MAFDLNKHMASSVLSIPMMEQLYGQGSMSQQRNSINNQNTINTTLSQRIVEPLASELENNKEKAFGMTLDLNLSYAYGVKGAMAWVASTINQLLIDMNINLPEAVDIDKHIKNKFVQQYGFAILTKPLLDALLKKDREVHGATGKAIHKVWKDFEIKTL